MVLNISAFFLPIRNPAVYQLDGGKEISLTYAAALDQINKTAGESDTQYVYRLTHVVNQSIAHYWNDEGIDTYYLHVPPWNNYILWLSAYIYPHTFLKYEFTDYHRALQRGIGLCSEQSLIMVDVLQENGIRAKMIGLKAHVVAAAWTDGKWFISDPDYGVVLPYSIEDVEQNPAVILPYYKDMVDPALILSIYGTKTDLRQYASAGAYNNIRQPFEDTAYIAIWVIPVFLILPLIFFYIDSRKNKKR
jgi:hypothetical protein